MRIARIACMLLAPLIGLASAEEPSDSPAHGRENISLHAQATYVFQRKPAFDALYSGPNSLTTDSARSYSLTTTLFAGARLAGDIEAYVDVEGTRGLPVSNLTGQGGIANGELEKTAGTVLKWYRARAFVRKTFGFGGGPERIEAEANQLAGSVDKRRLVITAGNLAVVDLFDDNRYAKDPRTDFLNWSLITAGAYDFAADSRGYTWGAAAEWIDEGWAMRAGRFAQPRESNGLPLDYRLLRHYGDQVEIEHDVAIGERAGKWRVLAFRNVAVMGRYDDALALARAAGTIPQLSSVRRRNTKGGFVVNGEQELGSEVGAFARASWNDGRTETYAFAEIDRSLALGVSLGGKRWSRDNDTLGVAGVYNALGAAHRAYLAAGGLGFFVGDGRINYRAEQIAEAYYRIGIAKAWSVSLDVQHVRNPAYNADRGPVFYGGIRLHGEI